MSKLAQFWNTLHEVPWRRYKCASYLIKAPPVPLRQSLPQHEVSTAYERGWSMLKNGELLDTAEREGFAVLITTNSNFKYQQNLKARHIAIIALTSTSWPRIQRAIGAVVGAVNGVSDGSYTEVEIP